MLMLIRSIYPRAGFVNRVTTAAPGGLSSVLVSATVTLRVVEVQIHNISK